MPGYPDIALGADEFLYASVETTFGVWKRPVANDGVRVKEITFGRTQERVTRDDKLGTRSHTERITRKKAVEWSTRMYVVPSGLDPAVSTIPPDARDLLKALLGSETINLGVNTRYDLIRNQNVSLTLHRICDHFSESLTGCVPNNCTFRISGTDEPELEFSGFGKDWVITGTGVCPAGALIGAFTAVITDAEDRADINSVVCFYNPVAGTLLTNGGIGYHISAVAPLTDTITTDEPGGWEAALEAGAEMRPWFPTPSTQGSPCNSITGGLTVDAVPFMVTEGSIEYSNNMEARNDIYGYDSAIGFSVSGRRDVNGSFTSYLEKDYAPRVKNYNRFSALHDVVITMGTVAGSICEIHMPTFEFDNVPFTVPDQAEATVAFTGRALDNASPFEGEFYIIFR
jgi:hypothetical protein